MKNQMSIPTPSQLKFIEKENMKHKKKLEEIHGQDRKAQIVEKNIAVGFKVSQTRQINIQASKKGKLDEIEQTNELLLGKLVEISRKKATGLPTRSESTSALRSLHAPYKKKEMMRISSENETFARRLISQQSTFNRKKLDLDYKKHKELVSHIKRINVSPLKNFPKRLPPIQSAVQSPNVHSSLKQSEISARQSDQVKITSRRNSNVQSNKEVISAPVTVSVVKNEEAEKIEKVEETGSKGTEQVDNNTNNASKPTSVAGIENQGNTQEAGGENKPGNQSQRSVDGETKPKSNENNQEQANK